LRIREERLKEEPPTKRVKKDGKLIKKSKKKSTKKKSTKKKSMKKKSTKNKKSKKKLKRSL